MTPQELKNSILQLAIQGKLVEQRPEEGTARELFVQIQAEKQRLIEAGKIKKEKPLPEIAEDEKPFDIPEGWMWCRLGDIFQHNTGKALNSTNRNGISLKYITTSNLYWNRFELENLKEMYFSDTEIEKCTIKKGDLLVCEGGDFGRAAIWKNDGNICIQNHVHRLRAFYTVCTEFFYYLFYLYKHAGWIGGKGIGIQCLSSKAIHVIVFPLPPLAEQKRIVAKIEELLPYIDHYEQAWGKLEQLNSRFPEDMKKALLQYAIQGKLVEQRPEEGTGEELFAQIQAEKQRLIQAGKIKKEKPLPEIAEDAGPSGTQTASPAPLPPSAAPAGITHYTLQARSCAKGEAQAPFGNPRFCRRVGLETHSALHILQPYKTQRNGAGQRAGMKQADIKNLFSGCNHLIYGL